MKTHQITVRNVDANLKKRIATNAKLNQQSINDWVLDAIKKKAGVAGSVHEVIQPPAWKAFSGALKDEDVLGADFLEDIEAIDEQMWAQK
jgi:uncharacterized protein (DUF1778 family)